MMIRGLVLLAMLLVPALAQAQRAVGRCPDMLIGDSFAIGMAPHAQRQGYVVHARQGAGMAWLRQQPPRCARTLVVMFGTNDLRSLGTEAAAESYVRAMIAVTDRWDADRLIWATPGCFPRDAALDRGSEMLERVLVRIRTQHLWAFRFLPSVNSGRALRCGHETRDGVHPSGTGYQAWWGSIARDVARRDFAGFRPRG
ncbi:MAG: hypothetical protein V4653_03015 [Pseudomonadota bacterium]